ncbi:hypothetical protein CYY_008630 [Polysphondylium violaceum]|uniref:OTU domain-containing protein n=1 Tax=Polysphondylium violaceum TaxID=133409 RepID=A0A8J4UX53_9MYCE|nr:hypothetical protein CYY_008630 [Polysphondylium violaceum]
MGKGNKSKQRGGPGGGNGKKNDRMVKAALRKRKERLKHGDEKWRQGIKAFSAQLEPMGLIIKDVAGDGNCLFRSIADQLEDNPNSHMKYRQAICKFLIANKEMFAPFVDDEEHDSYEEYVEEMQEDTTWGGNIEIQAASLLYSVNITIHQLNQPRWDIENFFGNKPRTIQLSYHNDEHYNSVRPINAPFFPPQANSVGSQSTAAASTTTTTTTSTAANSNSSSGNDDMNYHTISEEVYQIMEATGVTSVKLVKEALEDCNYNTDLAIDLVLALASTIKDEKKDDHDDNDNKKTTTTTTTTTTTSSSNNKASKNPYKGVKKQQQQEQQQQQQDNKKEDTHLSNKERKKQNQQQNGTNNNNAKKHNIDRNSIVDDSIVDNLGSLNI